jgi:hypothetical protein
MNPDHIEAARVFIEKLASSKKHLADTVVQVPEPDGDICTVEMLHQVLHYEWLNGAVSMFILNNTCKLLCEITEIIIFVAISTGYKFLL